MEWLNDDDDDDDDEFCMMVIGESAFGVAASVSLCVGDGASSVVVGIVIGVGWRE